MNSLHAALVLMEFKQAIKGLFRHAPKQCMVVSQPILVHRFLILVSWLTESRNIDDRHEKIQIKLIHRKKEKSICNQKSFEERGFPLLKFFFSFQSFLFLQVLVGIWYLKWNMYFSVPHLIVCQIFCKLGPYYNCDT